MAITVANILTEITGAVGIDTVTFTTIWTAGPIFVRRRGDGTVFQIGMMTATWILFSTTASTMIK